MQITLELRNKILICLKYLCAEFNKQTYILDWGFVLNFINFICKRTLKELDKQEMDTIVDKLSIKCLSHTRWGQYVSSN